MHLPVHLFGTKNGQICDYIPIHELSLMVWLDVQELGRNVIGKLLTREFEKERSGYTTLNVQKRGNIYVPCECSLRGDFSRLES